jgi:hypothetical protein
VSVRFLSLPLFLCVTVMRLATQTHKFMLALLATVCMLATVGARAQALKETKDAGTITGHVTADGHGVAGVLVVLMPTQFTPDRKPVAQAKTDADGHYQITNVPPGSYYLNTSAPIYTNTDASLRMMGQGRLLNVAAGDQLEAIDFTLARGGVITGRVTNADGKPVIDTQVRLLPVEETGRRNTSYTANAATPFAFNTDDRGIYRLYGLPAGRYYVYVGEAQDEGRANAYNASYYPRTFYGDTTEQTAAKIVEVTGGAETTGVDITVGKPARTYTATGRVVDESGHAVVGAYVLYSLLNAQGGFAGSGSVIERTSERGDFQLKNMRPGRYAVYAGEELAFRQEQSTSYGDAVTFEIVEQDVSGLEIKLVRGATISGTLVVENTNSPAVLAQLSTLRLGAGTIRTTAEGFIPPLSNQAKVNADGSFLLTGLRPGKVRLFLGYPPQKGFALVRVERGGGVQAQGIEVAAAEQVTGVRVVLSYGTAVVRGQVQFPDGARPAGVQFVVSARRAGEPHSNPVTNSEVDELGRFVLENMSAGEYELTLQGYPLMPIAAQRRPPAERKLVNVPDSGEVQVTFVFNQSPPP